MKLGKYQHYKGGLVNVTNIAHHSETLEEFVVYEALYDCKTFGKGSVWIRPKSMFLENVEYKGKKISRFRFVE